MPANHETRPGGGDWQTSNQINKRRLRLIQAHNLDPRLPYEEVLKQVYWSDAARIRIATEYCRLPADSTWDDIATHAPEFYQDYIKQNGPRPD